MYTYSKFKMTSSLRRLVSRHTFVKRAFEDAVSSFEGTTTPRMMVPSSCHDRLYTTSLQNGRYMADTSNTPSNINATSRSYSNVPEHWGRDSPYHPGTEFLGTPQNHLELVKKRPISPHVFDDVGAGMNIPPKFHYKMPLGAVSSVTNRATGVMLSCGAGAAGWVALFSGDLATAIASFKSAYPLLVFPAKFAVAFPLVYHYLGGLRHLYWDHYSFGNQSERDSPLEYGKMEQSSKALLLTGSLGAVVVALYSI